MSASRRSGRRRPTRSASASTTAELEELRVRYLGRKAELTQILRGISDLPADERGPVGKSGNEARRELESLLESRSAELDASELGTQLAEDAIDVTLPGAPPMPVGRPEPAAPHPAARSRTSSSASATG